MHQNLVQKPGKILSAAIFQARPHQTGESTSNASCKQLGSEYIHPKVVHIMT